MSEERREMNAGEKGGGCEKMEWDVREVLLDEKQLALHPQQHSEVYIFCHF